MQPYHLDSKRLLALRYHQAMSHPAILFMLLFLTSVFHTARGSTTILHRGYLVISLSGCKAALLAGRDKIVVTGLINYRNSNRDKTWQFWNFFGFEVSTPDNKTYTCRGFKTDDVCASRDQVECYCAGDYAGQYEVIFNYTAHDSLRNSLITLWWGKSTNYRSNPLNIRENVIDVYNKSVCSLPLIVREPVISGGNTRKSNLFQIGLIFISTFLSVGLLLNLDS